MEMENTSMSSGNTSMSSGNTIPTSRRWGVYPLQSERLFAFFEKFQSSFWKATEINFDNDSSALERLPPDQRLPLKHTLGIFAIQDGAVIDNIVLRFLGDARTVEAKLGYAMQLAAEAVHAHSYGLQIKKAFPDPREQKEIQEAVDHLPYMKVKEAWIKKYMEGDQRFAIRLVAFAALEGIGFSALFAVVYWYRIIAPGLRGVLDSNHLIATDEGLHRDFAIAQHDELPKEEKCTREEVIEVIESLLEVELLSVDSILEKDFETLRRADLRQYLYFVADHLLISLGFAPQYQVSNPLDYMNKIGAHPKDNFFEVTATVYSKPTASGEDDDDF
jgi:ribonucleotide reductase beta subunit family protein with ferritin-like domain